MTSFLYSNGNSNGSRTTVRQVKQDDARRKIQIITNSIRRSIVGEFFYNSPTAAAAAAEDVVYGDGHYIHQYSCHQKPLPPPPQQQQQQQTPPPYRMPLYSMVNESLPGIPGSTCEYIASSSSPSSSLLVSATASSPSQLRTHSSKFPIEREVILTNIDKNSKIPILHDLKKRPKGGIIAPDIPPKQMAAWTQVQIQSSHQILPDQTHPGLIQSAQPTTTTTTTDNSIYKSPYQQQQSTADLYGGNSASKSPQTIWDGSKSNYSYPSPQQVDESNSQQQSTAIQIENQTLDANKSNTRGVSKTYHAIKDIISGKFKNKECDGKIEKTNLNNVTDELRRSQGNLAEDLEKNKTHNDQANNNQSTKQQHQHIQYSQRLIQQHLIAQQQQQILKNCQPQIPATAACIRNQQQQQQYSQLIQARSQEMLATRHDDQVYYQAMRFVQQQQMQNNAPDQRYNQNNKQVLIGNEIPRDRESVMAAFERRSAQQLERDNLRQRSFEARRTASQPHLLLDDDTAKEQNKPAEGRGGSQNNLVEIGQQLISPSNRELEQESDDGGFLKRTGSKETYLSQKNSESGKVTEILQGPSRKKLEGEIGKIEGVYNINSRLNYAADEPRAAGARSPAGNGNIKSGGATGSGTSSDYDRTGGRASSNIDSGRGSAAYSSGRRPAIEDLHETDVETNIDPSQLYGDQNNDSEWVDITDHELRHILEPKLHELSLHKNNPAIANSTVSESISSMTPPLPPLSITENSSPTIIPKNCAKYKHSSLPYGSKPDYDNYKGKMHSRELLNNSRYTGSSQKYKSSRKMDHNTILRGKQLFGLDSTDLTSTTTRSLDLESMLDGQTDSDEDLSTTDARAIRKQLEGLETMYSEVLKLLGVNKKVGGKYQPSDTKFSKRRYGSMSSLPSSSVSSMRRERRSSRGFPMSDDRRKTKEPRTTTRRFQRLEAHVVTLARSVAHLSSEMRTQHLVSQEIEAVRQEVATLRAQTNMLNIRSQSASRATNSNRDLPTLANPIRVKKLTKFFGDEPPLLRLFLRKLGYEKYAASFENEKIGMVELPYLSEDRLQKMGIPLGPRLRIMQEAQISVCKENTLCIV